MGDARPSGAAGVIDMSSGEQACRFRASPGCRWPKRRANHARRTTGVVISPRILVIEGDITEQRVDAIVNAANSSLLGGGGVDGAIHRGGGPEILEACRSLRASSHVDGLPAGRAVATTAGRLPARWVIHTVGPVHATTEDRSALLASCHRASLSIADELGAATIAFPAISTGVYRWPLDDAARIAVNAVQSAATRVREVRFVLFSPAAHDAFSRALATSGTRSD